jgi:hypothetical protein
MSLSEIRGVWGAVSSEDRLSTGRCRHHARVLAKFEGVGGPQKIGPTRHWNLNQTPRSKSTAESLLLSSPESSSFGRQGRQAKQHPLSIGTVNARWTKLPRGPVVQPGFNPDTTPQEFTGTVYIRAARARLQRSCAYLPSRDSVSKAVNNGTSDGFANERQARRDGGAKGGPGGCRLLISSAEGRAL